MKLALLFLFILGCVSRTCLHGGDCLELENGGFHCRCKNGFSGATCNYLSGRRKTVIDLEWYRYGLVNMVMGVWYSKDCTYVMLFPVDLQFESGNTVIPWYQDSSLNYDSSFNYFVRHLHPLYTRHPQWIMQKIFSLSYTSKFKNSVHTNLWIKLTFCRNCLSWI